LGIDIAVAGVIPKSLGSNSEKNFKDLGGCLVDYSSHLMFKLVFLYKGTLILFNLLQN